jgi:hypothetical protein
MQTALTVAELAGARDPRQHAATVAAAFLPDVLRYTPGVPQEPQTTSALTSQGFFSSTARV